MAHPDDHISDPALVEAEALLALGRLDGALGTAGPATLRLFALRLLRDVLITALRQEGHMFTGQRFHAWFAGVATLADQPPRAARPPKVLCEAMLTELAHSSWDALAGLAARFQPVLRAPGDHVGSAPEAVAAHQNAHAAVTAARDLIAGLGPCPLPLPALARLHRALAEHILFAPAERTPQPIVMDRVRFTAERAAAPSPRWALEMLWGEHWRRAGLVSLALPFPGIIRLDALPGATPDGNAAIILAAALRDVAHGLHHSLTEADQLARRLDSLQPGQRRSSRAPALLELLAGFGPMRSSQLEMLLGATRLGVRTMLGALGETGVLDRSTVAGVRLYSVTVTPRPAIAPHESAASSTFSSAALGEFDEAMADIDALLVRIGTSPGEARQEGEP